MLKELVLAPTMPSILLVAIATHQHSISYKGDIMQQNIIFFICVGLAQAHPNYLHLVNYSTVRPLVLLGLMLLNDW